MDQTTGVFIGNAGDDPESFLLNGGGQIAHAAPGSTLAIKILVDNSDRKCRLEFHAFLQKPRGQTLRPPCSRLHLRLKDGT